MSNETNPVTLHHGNALEILKSMTDCSVDAVVTDPPYGLSDFPSAKVADAITRWATGERDFIPQGAGFMGAQWDCFVPPPAMWDECYRVLKPGGHMFVFSGARTVDLMGLSIRLAGFDLRDSIAWIRSDGMPKGQEVSKAMKRKGVPDKDAGKWEDWHSALKPAVEPVIVARKALDGTLVNNVLTHGTGALNIKDSRVPASARPLREVRLNGTEGTVFKNGKGSVAVGTTDQGRFTANVLLDRTAAEAMDTQSGVLTSGKPAKTPGGHKRNQPPGEGIFGGGKGMWKEPGGAGTLYGDSGGASRFFNVIDNPADQADVPFLYCPKAPQKERPRVNGVTHVSVKPVKVMDFIVKLAAPEGAVILDPFAGSGTTGQACVNTNRRAILIEREEKYIPLIKQRLGMGDD